MHEPICTLFLVLATSGVAFWAFENPQVQDWLMFRPDAILAGKEHYRLLTSSFPHCGGWQHLLWNMYALYIFGGRVEWWIGPIQMLLVYFGSVLGGNLLSLYIHRFHDYGAAGASGGVCGLIFAYVLGHPSGWMMMFPLPYSVPAWLYAIGFVIASFYAMKVQEPTVAHDAHLGGSLSGLVILAALHPEVARRHWMVFATLLVLGALVFAYVHYNPLFLPLSSFRPAAPKLRRSRHATGKVPQTWSPARAREFKPVQPPTDWLIEKIEEQVGKLVKDPSGLHDWVDKFGRTYDVIGGDAEDFDVQAFKAAVMDRLNKPTVRFVIIDARKLSDSQIAMLRPFIADLPDAQFNRIIRSYGFTPPK